MQEIKSVCLRVFLTSRPELPIRLGFEQDKNHQDLVLHALPAPVIEHDIRVFLEYKLSKIQQERSLPPDWPGNDNVERLVQMAVPSFIFAATLCRFVGDRDWLPEKRLAAVLQDETATATSDMDRTYIPVLNQLLASKNKRDSRQLLQEFQNIIGVIILLATPLSVVALAQLTSISTDDISNRLNRFYAVLNVPEDLEAPVRILHLSFRDFLVSTEGKFHVDEKQTHRKIASHCLRVMETRLEHNICGLASYGTQHKDIDPQVINQHLTAELQYSCRYWVYHLKQSQGRISESEILSFLRKRFLHWLEALALIGSSVNSVAFSPDGRTLASGSLDHTIKLWDTTTGTERQTLKGHSGWVNLVAFSPDRYTLASGSLDNTIKLWDTTTGTERQTLKGHSSSVNSVAFSPDGYTLASGSLDHTIKLWDTTTGTERQTLKGHSDSVETVLNKTTSHQQVTLSNTWISSGGETLLWLPAEYRSVLSYAVKDTTIALGYMDGRVCIIGFHS
ncbi:unnamed protein product [Aspergillus oryzae]|uniref:Mitochondrial division protein 1 n=1 Tax=Aspergillus oryzae TaxID=5062 RepID=A0AAN5C5T4_ASPOZ|nr:unnamed protein product [Aspergillus oryzae]